MASFFGVDYYPEHWPASRWETDAALMEAMGLTVVRMGEFAWAKFEPEQGVYDFAWMDEAIATMKRHHIRVILGTPTAAPPAWMIAAHPEYLPITSSGVQMGFGGRHHNCQSHPGYRAHVRGLVTAMAEHYRDEPAVFAWQVDNELGNSHDDLCFCPQCERAFQLWLQRKYRDIEALNEAWGTCFWSQTYTDFSQVPAPRKTPNSHNPSHMLNWNRFCSDLIVDYQQEQVDILRRICPQHLITHNMMGMAPKVDYYDLGRALDVVSNDQYPTGFFLPDADVSWPFASAALDFIHGVRQQNFWMMELQAGASGTEMMGETPRPNQFALWTANAVAHGADSIVWFRWRTCLFGCEQYWHGILPHNGEPGARYDELRGAIARLSPVLADVDDVYTRAQVAVLFDYDQLWAFKQEPHHRDLDYTRQLCAWYEAFSGRHVAVDFMRPDADFAPYRVIVAPLLHLVGPALCEKLKAFAHAGGTLVLTFRSAVKDREGNCFGEGNLPHGLTDAIGATVEEYTCLYRNEPLGFHWQDGASAPAGIWQDMLQPHGAEVLATAQLEGEPAYPVLTENQYGQGHVYYMGTAPAQEVLHTLAERILDQAGIQPWGEADAGVTLHMRRGRAREYLFVLNSTGMVQPFALYGDWTPLDGEGNTVSRYGFRVFARPMA